MSSFITNIVFSGGGVKGYSYIGVIKALEELDIINNIKNVAGTSIGSLFALLIVLKYTFNELNELCFNIDLEQINNISSDNILNFVYLMGIDDGSKCERILKILLKAKTSVTDITFKELYEYNNINLTINSARINDRKNIIYNHIKTPDFSVIMAIRMSISIPFIYTPVLYENNYYVDGGVTNNFLIELFKNEIENTLGFLIKDPDNNKISDIYEYIGSVFYSLIDTDREQMYNKYNIILLESEINSININIDENTKKILIDEGYNNTKDYLKNCELKKNLFVDKNTQTDINTSDNYTQTE